MQLKLINVFVSLDEKFGHFRVEDYEFYSLNKKFSSDRNKNIQNSIVKFKGKQKNSILFSDSITGEIGIIGNLRFGQLTEKPRKRKLIEDVLILGSILSGYNWYLYSRKSYPQYPLCRWSYLECVSRTLEETQTDINNALSKIKNKKWQIQYDNGFHLRMIVNHANIFNQESRFLANMVIWEWLYPHIKNPGGATSKDESMDLNKIINFILNNYWPEIINKNIFNDNNKNIFCVLRNQLAHSGKLPINRDYAKAWMKEIPLESHNRRNNITINDYLTFFDYLTQIIVLKTLEIDAENRNGIKNRVDNFLKKGKI